MPTTRTQQAGSPPIEGSLVDQISTRLRAHLEGKRRLVAAEIHAYPTPIAGCDVQFNHLLEERNDLCEWLSRLEATIARGRAEANDIEAVVKFVAACPHLEEPVKRQITAELRAAG